MPRRDWIRESDFDPKTADDSSPFEPTFREQFREARDAAELFAWLCCEHDNYRVIGGQAWPLPATYPNGARAGYPFEQDDAQSTAQLTKGNGHDVANFTLQK